MNVHDDDDKFLHRLTGLYDSPSKNVVVTGLDGADTIPMYRILCVYEQKPYLPNCALRKTIMSRPNAYICDD
jgi:hypothetical protein